MTTASAARQLLADVRAALRVLWAAGLRRPDPTLPDQLRDLAHDARAVGWTPLAAPLDTLADTTSAALSDPRVDRASELFHQQRAVWVRVDLLSRRLALAEVGVTLEQEAAGTAPAAPPPRKGRSGELHPVGVERGEAVWQVQCVDPDGRWVTLEDRPLRVDPDDPFRGRTTSRLFHDDIRLADALTGTIELRDHPGTRTRRRWVGRPAFHTRPRIQLSRRAAPALPSLTVGARYGLWQTQVCFAHTPAGWRGRAHGMPVEVGPRLAFDLDKRDLMGVGEHSLDCAVSVRGDHLVLLSVDEPPGFPTLDPACTTWALSDWLPSPTDAAEAERQDQLRALVWPLMGGDRGRLVQRLAPQTRPPRSLETRWAGQWAGRALGLPAPDACAEAEVALRAPSAATDDAEALLRALWLAVWADRPLEPVADALLEVRGGPIEAEDTLEIVLRGWLLVLGSHPEPARFLEAHGATWRGASVLPDVRELTWMVELWRLARDRAVEVPPLGLSRWSMARAALGELRRARGHCTEAALQAWRLVASVEVERWFLHPD